MNTDKNIFDIQMTTILIKNMRIANLMNYLNKIFENTVKFILKDKKINIVSSIHCGSNIMEIIATKSMTFKRSYSIT